MQLDELKEHLMQKMDTAHAKSANDIGAMLKKKTVSIVYKLKKSLLIEIIFCVAAIISFGCIGLFSKHWSLRVYFSTFTIVIALFMIVLIFLHKRIRQLGNSQLSVKSNLQLIHSIIKEYTRRAFLFTIALIPICLAFAFWLGLKDNDDFSFDQSPLARHIASGNTAYWLIILYGAVLIVATYYSTRWYLKKLYGKYLIQLQECINELEE